MPVEAFPGDAELVIDDIQIDPPHPQEGELVTITGDVYNAGLVDTNSLASIISVAYFVDGELLYIGDIGNVKPGLNNKIKISSTPIWNAELGNHDIKIIIDYHDTLNDKYDSFEGNVYEKTFSVKNLNSMDIFLDSSPKYVTPNKDTLLKITVSAVDSDSNEPLYNKKIILNFDDQELSLVTGKDGKTFFSKTANSFKTLEIESYFEGDDQYMPSNSSLTIYSIPDDAIPVMIMNIVDIENQYNFEDYDFEFLVFQNSYDNLIKKVSPVDLLDYDSFWISLPPDHDYFTEVYLDGRLVFLTDKKHLPENSMVVEELVVPQSAEVQFRIIDEDGEPVNNAVVDNWIYTATSGEDGLTEWIEVLPTVFDNPYVSEVTLHDGKTLQPNPFLVFSGERKTIDVPISETPLSSEIPNWIQNNANWWADGQIDDASFIDAIQFLIKKNILQIPPTIQNDFSTSDEIPNWIQNNANWWADGQIDDASFIDAIQFLIEKGIIRVS